MIRRAGFRGILRFFLRFSNRLHSLILTSPRQIASGTEKWTLSDASFMQIKGLPDNMLFALYVQRGASDCSQGFEDKNLGSSPGLFGQ